MNVTLPPPPLQMMVALTNTTHHGMIYVPAGFSCPGTQFDMSEIHGGSAWGPGCLAGPDGSRKPSEKELEFARVHGASGPARISVACCTGSSCF